MGNRFYTDIRGNFAVTAAIVALPIMAAVGAAVDYSSFSQERTKAQDNLDAAVLAGLVSSSDELEQITNARRHFHDYKSTAFRIRQVRFWHEGDLLKGSAKVVKPTSFLGLLGVQKIKTVVESAAAYSGGDNALRCIHALDRMVDSSLILNSKPRSSDVYQGASLMAVNCDVQVDSSAQEAVELKAGDFFAGSNCFVGGASDGPPLIQPAAEPSCAPLSDPFAGYALKYSTTCDYSAGSYGGGGNVTLNPGVYCGGMEVEGTNVTFKSGTYIVLGGALEVEADENVVGDGVSFLVETGGFAIDANTVNLKASKTGPIPAFLVFDRSGTIAAPTSSKKKKKKKNKTLENLIRWEEYAYLEGIVYSPRNHVEMRWRRPATDTSPYWTAKQTPFAAFIANTLDFHGYSQLVFNYEPDKTDLPIPKELAGQQSRTPRLVY